jgi:hypothetical protein
MVEQEREEEMTMIASARRCAFDYRTGEVISPVPERVFIAYVESLQDDPIGAVSGDDWGFPDRLIYMW